MPLPASALRRRQVSSNDGDRRMTCSGRSALWQACEPRVQELNEVGGRCTCRVSAVASPRSARRFRNGIDAQTEAGLLARGEPVSVVRDRGRCATLSRSLRTANRLLLQDTRWRVADLLLLPLARPWCELDGGPGGEAGSACGADGAQARATDHGRRLRLGRSPCLSLQEVRCARRGADRLALTETGGRRAHRETRGGRRDPADALARIPR